VRLGILDNPLVYQAYSIDAVISFEDYCKVLRFAESFNKINKNEKAD
jgi:hypothetical protein